MVLKINKYGLITEQDRTRSQKVWLDGIRNGAGLLQEKQRVINNDMGRM